MYVLIKVREIRRIVGMITKDFQRNNKSKFGKRKKGRRAKFGGVQKTKTHTGGIIGESALVAALKLLILE